MASSYAHGDRPEMRSVAVANATTSFPQLVFVVNETASSGQMNTAGFATHPVPGRRQMLQCLAMRSESEAGRGESRASVYYANRGRKGSMAMN